MDPQIRRLTRKAGRKSRASALSEFGIAFALEPDKKVGKLAKQALNYLGADTGEPAKAAAPEPAKPIEPPKDPFLEKLSVTVGGRDLVVEFVVDIFSNLVGNLTVTLSAAIAELAVFCHFVDIGADEIGFAPDSVDVTHTN